MLLECLNFVSSISCGYIYVEGTIYIDSRVLHFCTCLCVCFLFMFVRFVGFFLLMLYVHLLTLACPPDPSVGADLAVVMMQEGLAQIFLIGKRYI